MELTQLYQFKITAETKNINEASTILGITQSTLTKSIQNLENELGIVLFNRIGKKLSLTHNGADILSYVNSIIANADYMMQDISNINNESAFRICSSVSSIMNKMPSFYEENPDIYIYPQIRENVNFKQYLLGNIFDAVITENPIIHSDIDSIPVFNDHMWLSIPLSNRLSEKKTVQLNDLEGQTIIATRGYNEIPLSALFIKMIKTKNIKTNFYIQATASACEYLARNSEFLYFASSLDIGHIDLGDKRKFILISPNENTHITYYLSYLKKSSRKHETEVLGKWIKYGCSPRHCKQGKNNGINTIKTI